MLLLFPEYEEMDIFISNIESLNKKIENRLKRTNEKELFESFINFSNNAFSNLKNIPRTNKLSIYEESLIKEIHLVNSIFKSIKEKIRYSVARLVKVLKIAMKSLIEFAADEFKNALTIIDELLDLIEFIWSLKTIKP